MSLHHFKTIYLTHLLYPLRHNHHRHVTASVPYPPHWEKLARKELGGEIGPRELEWITPEGIKLKPLYTGMVVTVVAILTVAVTSIVIVTETE